jgi:hypothetical protein
VTVAPAEPGPPASTPAPVAAPAAAARFRVLLVRGMLALVLAVAALILAVLLYRHGVQQWPFGPVPPEKSMTEVPRYIGPWMVASAAALLAAGLLLISAGSDAYRLAHSRRAAHRHPAATG